jgi:hypothetical protein
MDSRRLRPAGSARPGATVWEGLGDEVVLFEAVVGVRLVIVGDSGYGTESEEARLVPCVANSEVGA